MRDVFSALTACTESCGPDDVATRAFAITTAAANGGAACTLAAGDVETQPCNTAIDCLGGRNSWEDSSWEGFHRSLSQIQHGKDGSQTRW